MIRLWIDGKPIPKGRPRMARNGHCFTPARTRDAEAALVQSVLKQLPKGWEPLDGPLRVTLMFGLSQAKSNRTSYPVGTPDLDNLAKLFCDAMNKILWRDDAQIVELVISKFWALEAGTECWLEQINGDNT